MVTVHYQFKQPTLSGDKYTWGDSLNSNWGSVDDIVAAQEQASADADAHIVATTDNSDATAALVAGDAVDNATNATDITNLPPIATGFMHPIGCVYLTTDTADPATVLGFGTWTPLAAGRALVGVGSGWALGEQRGTDTHVLSYDEMARHGHKYGSHTDSKSGPGVDQPGTSGTTRKTGSKGGGEAHDNRQPSIGILAWSRTA